MHFALNRVRIEGFQQHSPNWAVLLKPWKRKVTRVRSIPRQETLKARPQNKKSNRTPFAFVITHNPALPNVSTTVRKNINILQSSNRCKQTCPSPPIVAYKRSPILFEVLVRSTLRDFSIQEKPSLDVLKCNHPRCLTCSFLKQGHPIQLKVNLHQRNEAHHPLNIHRTKWIYLTVGFQ